MDQRLSILGCILVSTLHAQPTMEMVDSPQIGDVLLYEDLAGPFASLPGGAEQVWDLTCPGMGQIVEPEPFLFIDPAQTSGWPFFQDGTLAGVHPSTAELQISYFRTTPNGLEDIGEYHDPGVVYVAPDPQLLIPYPCIFGDTWLDTTLWCLDTTICLVHHESCSADGFGTLILPAGVVDNVLRTRCVEERITDVDGEAQIETFTNDRYWKSGYPFYLAWVSSYRYQIGQQAPVEDHTVQRLMDLTSLVSADGIMPEALQCRYDPMSADLIFNWSGASSARAEVLDGNGRVLAAMDLLERPGALGQYAFPLGSLASGAYLLRLLTDGTTEVGRFVITP